MLHVCVCVLVKNEVLNKTEGAQAKLDELEYVLMFQPLYLQFLIQCLALEIINVC